MTRIGIAHSVDATQIPWSVINDRRLASADLGTYVRFAYAAQLYDRPDIGILVREFKMPRAETEASLQRLIALGLLEEFPGLPDVTTSA